MDEPNALDNTVAQSLPEEVFAIADMVPTDAEHPIQKSKDFREAAELLTLFCLDATKPMSYGDMTIALRTEFPDLAAITEKEVEKFCEKFLMPHIFMPKRLVMRGIMRARRDMNTVERQLAIRDTAMEALDQAKKTMNLITRDAEGKPHKIGPSAAEVAALAKAASDANQKAEESLERWDLIPAKKSTGNPGVDINLKVEANPGSAMSRLTGRSKILDADAYSKPNPPDED